MHETFRGHKLFEKWKPLVEEFRDVLALFRRENGLCAIQQHLLLDAVAAEPGLDHQAGDLGQAQEHLGRSVREQRRLPALCAAEQPAAPARPRPSAAFGERVFW